MLKKIAKSIRRQLLKINWLRREVEAYKQERENQQHHEDWAQLMHSGCKVRELKPEKREPYDTLAVVTDDGVPEEWQGGKVVGRESLFIDSRNWG
jgi:hypothetical protein